MGPSHSRKRGSQSMKFPEKLSEDDPTLDL